MISDLTTNQKTLIIVMFAFLLTFLQIYAWQNGFNGTIRAIFTGFFAAIIFYLTGYKIGQKPL